MSHRRPVNFGWQMEAQKRPVSTTRLQCSSSLSVYCEVAGGQCVTIMSLSGCAGPLHVHAILPLCVLGFFLAVVS